MALMARSDGPVRVAHLVSTLHIGGLEMVVYDLARQRDRSTFDVRVICLGALGDLAPRFAALGVPVESLGWSGQGRARVALRLARRLRALRTDVLHTHNPDPHHIGTLARVMARVPVLVHTKHGRNYPKRPRAVAANRWASRWTDRIVPVSDDAARVAIEIERVAPTKVGVIHNGVDLAQYEVPRRPTSGPMLRAVHVARLNRIKDQPTLLHAARIVLDAVPEFRLDLVGDGERRAELEALHAELGLGDRVRFLGFRDDIQRILAESDLFVLSSLSEGISITLLEAMAAGLPVVATRVGGNPEVVVDGVTGRLVPERNPEALAAAVLDLVRGPEAARRMGAAGRRRVEDEFDLRCVARRYEDLYLALFTRGATAPVATAPARERLGPRSTAPRSLETGTEA